MHPAVHGPPLTTRISVVVVEDEAMVRAGLIALLHGEPDVVVVGEAADGRSAVEVTRQQRPDVVLMDLRLPVLDGVAATRELTTDELAADGTAPKVLVLTTFDDDERVRAALRAGAHGYLLKHAAPQDLAAAVRRVAAGDAWIDPAVAASVLAALRGPTRDGRSTASAVEAVAALTNRERDVLELMARGLTNDEIVSRLFIAPATVRTHVSRVLTKTGSRNRAEAVGIAYESGLVVPGS